MLDQDIMPWVNVDATKETDFQADLIDMVDGYDYVMFVTDDTMFVRDFYLSGFRTTLDIHPDLIGASLRLGYNTKTFYMDGDRGQGRGGGGAGGQQTGQGSQGQALPKWSAH